MLSYVPFLDRGHLTPLRWIKRFNILSLDFWMCTISVFVWMLSEFGFVQFRLHFIVSLKTSIYSCLWILSFSDVQSFEECVSTFKSFYLAIGVWAPNMGNFERVPPYPTLVCGEGYSLCGRGFPHSLQAFILAWWMPIYIDGLRCYIDNIGSGDHSLWCLTVGWVCGNFSTCKSRHHL